MLFEERIQELVRHDVALLDLALKLEEFVLKLDSSLRFAQPHGVASHAPMHKLTGFASSGALISQTTPRGR
jgi:hypothetical protein